MAEMVDPTAAMMSFREAVANGIIDPDQGKVHPEVLVLLDREHGFPRFTCARLENGDITAVVIIAPAEDYKGQKCFQIGYAVPEEHRRKGHAKAIIPMALDEFKWCMDIARIKEFHIEAMIDADNEPSNKLALATISNDREEVTEKLSGKVAYQYFRKFPEAARRRSPQ